MNSNRRGWINGLVVGAATITLSGALYARGPGKPDVGIGSPGSPGGPGIRDKR